MENRLTRKLEAFALLDPYDRGLLDDVVRSSRDAQPGEALMREGDEPSSLHVVLEGMACRHKHLPDGKRQIVAYLVAGDLCDVHGSILRRTDHGLSAISRCRIVDIPRGRIAELSCRPAIQRALQYATLVDVSVSREWIVNIGSRAPDQRIAHFFCEMMVRLRAVGLGETTRCQLPLTQAHLAETLGLSTVHINRTLMGLQQKGLCSKKREDLHVADFERLAAFSNFDANYLHLDGAKVADQRPLALVS